MTNKELRKKAEKKVQAKIAFYLCAIIFSGVSVVLTMLCYFIPAISPWLMLPIPIFLMVLAILYITAFGIPGTGEYSENWQEEEIQKKMILLSRKTQKNDYSAEVTEQLETIELEELEKTYSQRIRKEDFV